MRTATAAALCALCFCGVASANNNNRKAGEKHNMAMRLFDLGRYEDAIIALDEGYLLNPRPSFIYNRAMMLNRLGDLELRFDRTLARRYYVRAADSLRHYLDRDPNASDTADVRLNIAGLYNFADKLEPKEELTREREPRPPQDSGNQPALKPSRQGPHGPRLYTIDEIERADRVFRNVGLIMNAIGVVLLSAGIAMTYSATEINNDIEAAFGNKETAKGHELTSRKDALLAIGVVGLGVGGLSTAIGTFSLALPAKYRLWIVSLGQGMGLKGSF